MIKVVELRLKVRFSEKEIPDEGEENKYKEGEREEQGKRII